MWWRESKQNKKLENRPQKENEKGLQNISILYLLPAIRRSEVAGVPIEQLPQTFRDTDTMLFYFGSHQGMKTFGRR
jgi:hypothetical protein